MSRFPSRRAGRHVTKAGRVLSIGVLVASFGCNSPTPETSSSTHWATCSTVSDCASVPGAVACTGGYCVDANGQRLQSGSGPGPCDPLTAHELPVTLGNVLGIGKDAAGTIYLADEVPDKSLDRVFVSSGDTLFRKRVTGSGSSGGGADADYTFTFEEGFDAATARAVLIQHRGGSVTAMALGPGSGKGFIGDPGATTETLTVLDQSAIASLKLRNLPGSVTIEYVADVDNGDLIVVTHPSDDYGYSDFRLFYGPQAHLVERKVVNVLRGNSTDILFMVGSTQYDVHFQLDLFPTDAGVAVHIGPGSLDTGGGTTIGVTERRPVPTSLPAFEFTCL